MLSLQISRETGIMKEMECTETAEAKQGIKVTHTTVHYIKIWSNNNKGLDYNVYYGQD